MSPSLRRERELLRQGAALIAGIDEVGRGAIAGPVSVGVVLVDATTGTAPTGLRDSKLLTPQARERLHPRVGRWARHRAVGHATPAEIDTWGIMAALRLAALRALAACPPADVAILDGSYDYLTAPGEELFTTVPWPDVTPPRVVTVVKGDRICSSVAAASVLAKVERDRRMTGLAADHPHYCWDVNKGYATPEHSAGIRSHGLCDQHRRSWTIEAAIDLTEAAVLAGPAVHTVPAAVVLPSR